MAKAQTLSSVTQNLIENPAQVSNNQSWQAKYNIAAWITFNDVPQEPQTLLVTYQDQERFRTVEVDQGFVNSGRQILLSNQVSLKAVGKIKEMMIQLKSNQAGRVDELFLQKVQSAVLNKQLLSSMQ